MVSILSGLLLGAIGGYTVQRGGFCMHSAFRSMVFEKDHSILRTWMLVLLINIPVLLLLEQVGIIFPARAPLTPLAGLIGGLTFGVGMVLAGGCVSGTYYRASKGMTGSLVALLGFAAGGLAITRGSLRPILEWATQFELHIAGEEASLFNLPSTISSGYFAGYGARWIIVVIVSIPLAWYLYRGFSKRNKNAFTIGWPWWLTGIVFSAVAIGAWIFSSLEFRDYGLSFVQPTNALSALVLLGDGDGINWASWFLIGFIPGAVVAAIKGGDWSLRVPSAARLVQNLGGGILMGIGANLAGGCNIGHGVTGISVFSLGSIWATATTMAGVWIATWVLYARVRQQSNLSPATGA